MTEYSYKHIINTPPCHPLPHIPVSIGINQQTVDVRLLYVHILGSARKQFKFAEITQLYRARPSLATSKTTRP